MSEQKLSPHEMKTLVELAQGGDAEAFGRLYDSLVAPIYRYIYYRVGREEAEDLTELAFLKAWENLNKYKPQKGNPFSAWLFRIAHNLVVDYYRARSKTENVELSEDLASDKKIDDPSSLAQLSFDQIGLKRAIRQLPELAQQVIVLKFINEFDNEEIAKIIDKSNGAVRVIQFRALAELKALLEKENKPKK
jgi:RNA polymerase sigma-70 factor (ECF subfamily)